MSDTQAFGALLRRLSRTYRLGLAVIALVAVSSYAVTQHALGHIEQIAAQGGDVAARTQEVVLLQRASQASAVTILVVLLLESVFVFRPAVRRLRHEREARERSLELRNRALVAAHTADARRAESETRFRSSFDSAAIGMALVSFDGTLTEVNASLCEMLGYSEQELTGRRLTDLTHADEAETNAADLRRLAEGGVRSYRLEKRYLRRDGAIVWALVAAAAVRDADGHPSYAVVQVEDITAKKRAEQNAARYATELRTLALTDELTSVYNRRGFRLLAEQACLAQQRSTQPMLLVAADLDRLKFINDRWGHAAGDRALLIVATALTSTFRTSDVIGRMGGDEFLCLLPNATDVDETRVRERLAGRLAQLSADLNEDFPVTATVGVAVAAPGATVDLDALVREADRSLYATKHARVADEFETPPLGQPNRLR